MQIRPITGFFGARILDFDVDRAGSENCREELGDLLTRHKVLVFPLEDELSPAAFKEFAGLFGPLQVHALNRHLPDHPEIDLLLSDGVKTSEGFHSDLSYTTAPALATALRAVDVPAYGRDTIFVDTEAVYNGFSPVMQQMLGELTAIHDWRAIYASNGHNADDEKRSQAMDSLPPVEHPVVRTHPVSGRRSIYVSPVFTSRIVQLNEQESSTILRMIFDALKTPEYQLRVSWEPHTIAVWDNRSVEHALIFDFSYPRVMHRVTIAGDRPF